VLPSSERNGKIERRWPFHGFRWHLPGAFRANDTLC